MTKIVRVLGIDPGLAHLGYALVDVHPDKTIEPTIINDTIGLGLIETEKSNKKAKVLVSDDNTHRARKLTETIYKVFQDNTISLVSCESMSFPRSSSAAHKMGISWGVIVAICTIRSIPIVQASPHVIKKAICGRENASKIDVQEALLTQHIPEHRRAPARAYWSSLTKDHREHPFDALGSIYVAVESELFRAVSL